MQVREGVSEIRVVYYEDYADYGEEESGQTVFDCIGLGRGTEEKDGRIIGSDQKAA